MEEIIKILELLKSFGNNYNKLKQNLPYHVNVIDELHINENAHSRILCKLLLFRSDTGEYEILKSLIKYISKYKRAFDSIRIKSPEITQELERIDIWVKDKEGGYAIIFENKVYDANDQEAQIARYIKKTRGHDFKDEQIYIVYMPSISNYEPSEQTWVDMKTGKSLLGTFENRYAKVSFNEGILPWLKEIVLPNIRVKDGYLQSAISQYVDYLEGYFDKREINKNMNMKLNEFLEKELGLENITNDIVRKNILDKKTEEIKILLNYINSAIEEINNNFIKKWNNSKDIISGIAEDVANNNDLKAELSENDSSCVLRFYKEEWNLSIIFQKYWDHSFFVYIGKPYEERVEGYGGNKIFKENSQKANHPYGWEYIEKYHLHIEVLLEDIYNGQFRIFLNEKIKYVLEQISKNEIKMA